MVHIFGLTGGIASGKSTVAARLRARGVPVIDADVLAREVVRPGSEGLHEVVSAFGDGVLAADGSLDRKALARLVFADGAARARLNAITHPRIMQAASARARELDAAGEPLGCFEAALLFESGIAELFRPVVVVACSIESQVARIMARDGASQADALARVHAQTSTAEKVAAANHVIDTDVPLEAAARRTDEVLQAVCTAVGVDARRYLTS